MWKVSNTLLNQWIREEMTKEIIKYFERNEKIQHSKNYRIQQKSHIGGKIIAINVYIK